MNIQQIYTGCLAQGAYYIESKGEAIIIDPLREVEPYIQRAAKDGAQIKYVLETHFHADFVSGHLDLASKTGATIVYGPNAQPEFQAFVAFEGHEFRVGAITIQVIHTPGHTMESTCYLLKDESGKEVALFTGDTLFIGDVGRPDLAQKIAADLTQEKLAGHLYDSLQQKILPLPDDVLIYPAHGAGSACGKNMSKQTFDTLGNQKVTNYALQPMSKEAFIKKLTEGLETPPAYFPANVMLNVQGYESIDKVLDRGLQALSPEAFEVLAQEMNILILDTRDAQTFAKGFVPNSINIGIDGSFAPWVGALITDIRQQILLVTDEGREQETITRLARVGFDNTIGYLKGGFAAWERAGKEMDTIESVSAEMFSEKLSQDENLHILDVRKPGEYGAGHLETAENMPLDDINNKFMALNKEQTYFVHCAGGYRSMLFISILRARGYHHLIDVAGGMKAIQEAGVKVLQKNVCPSMR